MIKINIVTSIISVLTKNAYLRKIFHL